MTPFVYNAKKQTVVCDSEIYSDFALFEVPVEN